ncbi:DNA primase [bacterium]|nr:DNA primase [bacterium]
MSPIEEIKQKLDIVDVISEYLTLKKVGSNYRALCPFHKEKNPSFYVNPERQIWRCFGCSRGGDIFKFIMEIENVEFSEALKILAKKAGVELKGYEKVDSSKKNLLKKINQEAAKFFERNLWENREALDYLLKRGLKKETIKEFQLGFAQDNWHLLEKYLKEKGFLQTDIFEVGLLVKTEEGRFYDRFRSRIMFPLYDHLGNIIGFSGRIFGKETDAGKYVNTPQTLIFDKSQLLYGIHKSKEFVKKEKKALIVEGQMDFLMAWQNGLKYSVAVSGTAFTEKQLNILKRYANDLILCFDMDEAGEAACERSIFEAKKRDFSIEVLPLAFGKDLAELLKERPEETKKILSNKIPIMEFFFEKAKKVASLTDSEGRKKIADYFLTKIKLLVSPVEQGFWIEKLANFLKIKEEFLYDALKSIKVLKEKEEVKNEEKFLPETFSFNQLLSKKIIALILEDKEKFLNLKEIENLEKFLDKDYQEIFLKIKGGKEKEIEDKIAYLKLFFEYEFGDLKIDKEKELKKLIKLLKKETLKSEIEKINFEIKEAEESKNQKKAEELLLKVKELSEKLKQYQ